MLVLLLSSTIPAGWADLVGFFDAGLSADGRAAGTGWVLFARKRQRLLAIGWEWAEVGPLERDVNLWEARAARRLVEVALLVREGRSADLVRTSVELSAGERRALRALTAGIGRTGGEDVGR